MSIPNAKLFVFCVLQGYLTYVISFASVSFAAHHPLGRTAVLFRDDVSSSRRSFIPLPLKVEAATAIDGDDGSNSEDASNESQVVRAPLRFLGPYPTLALRFPALATSSQRDRNATGVSLDFVLDTAANTNTLNAQVAQELKLKKVGEAAPGLGAGGEIRGGDTFLLGDCELDGVSKEDRFVFMSELTASALPVASPIAAGILSLAFFYCFPGGVEFEWSTNNSVGQVASTASRTENGEDGPNKVLPVVTFYGNEDHLNLDGLTKISFECLPVSLLPSIPLCINGVEIPALFDTGSPITVLNSQAAGLAGISTSVEMPSNKSQDEKRQGWTNPFSKIVGDVKAAQKISEATARGDVVAIAGSDGQPIQLLKSQSKVLVESGEGVAFGESHVYVGDLPGLAALGGLGGGAPPAAVLGMDVLQLKPRLVFRAQQKEVYI